MFSSGMVSGAGAPCCAGLAYGMFSSGMESVRGSSYYAVAVAAACSGFGIFSSGIDCVLGNSLVGRFAGVVVSDSALATLGVIEEVGTFALVVEAGVSFLTDSAFSEGEAIYFSSSIRSSCGIVSSFLTSTFASFAFFFSVLSVIGGCYSS